MTNTYKKQCEKELRDILKVAFGLYLGERKHELDDEPLIGYALPRIQEKLDEQRNKFVEMVSVEKIECKENHGCNNDICIRRIARQDFKFKILDKLSNPKNK